jgi:drug/metabolite transporter (DMT)-like permease
LGLINLIYTTPHLKGNQLPVQSIPYVIFLGILFGTTLIASRFSVGQFEPSTYIALRLILASFGYICIYLFSVRGRKWPTDRNLWRHGALLGVFGTAVPMNFIVMSLQYQSSGMTAILITLAPAITVVMAHFFLPEEPLTGRKIVGVAMALSGALLLVLLGETGLPDISQSSPIGYLLVFTAMVCGSATTVYARRFMKDLDTIQVSSVRIFVAALVVIPYSALFVGFDLSRVNQQGYLALGWASLAGTLLAMMIAFYNIQRFGATAAAMTAYVIPVVASIGGYLLLDEQITKGMLVGMSFIVIGIAFINQREKPIDLVENV